ncbi:MULTISPECIES: nuclear transport factor 2 family protein [unclassified Streptomyces]|uniref:nuclear transport factor 2 family protein n=1 Tax=unclassified Streptomyces TaxID=2593676 RepID=UPI002023E8A1|nr:MULTISPECIES: nuclear transport factor 2 family protein [unclassified Streptomyces]WSC25127.1 nuclear transport factor 2 family protein [Streptomyces sp. NBC_01766]
MSAARIAAVAAVLVAVVVLAVTVVTGDHVRVAAKEAVRDTPDEHDPAALTALEPAVRGYVDAVDSRDVNALVAVFAPQATVNDTGRSFHGRAAIRDWARDEVIGGRLTVLKNTPKTNGTTLLVRFAPQGVGGFEADYEFDLRDGRIARLDLRYA